MVLSSAQALLPGQLQQGPRPTDDQGMGGILLVLSRKNGDNMSSQYLLVTKKHNTASKSGGLGLSMAARGLPNGLQSRHTEPPASLAQPSSQCQALSQAPVKIQGLCQMLKHSFRFSSL